MTTDKRYTPLAYRIAFASLQGMGVDLARKLLDVVGSEEQFFAMNEKELRGLTRGRSKIYRDDYRRECLQRAVSVLTRRWPRRPLSVITKSERSILQIRPILVACWRLLTRPR